MRGGGPGGERGSESSSERERMRWAEIGPSDRDRWSTVGSVWAPRSESLPRDSEGEGEGKRERGSVGPRERGRELA